MARSRKLLAKKDAPEEHPASKTPASGAPLRPVADEGASVAAVDTPVGTEATARQPAEPSQH